MIDSGDAEAVTDRCPTVTVRTSADTRRRRSPPGDGDGPGDQVTAVCGPY